MSAAINEPFLLASYQNRHRKRTSIRPLNRVQAGGGRGKKSTVDWRTRKKQEQGQTGLACEVGLYRLERLVL